MFDDHEIRTEHGPNVHSLSICIIGAGPSGLVTLKELKDSGHKVTVFESKDTVGGLFADAYEGLRMVSSSVVTAFSSHSDGTEAKPVIWSAQEYVKYQQEFCVRYGLLEHVRLGHKVLSVRKPSAASPFTVRVVFGGEEHEYAFDRLVCCAGTHRTPELPDIPGLREFGGTVVHSAHYRRPADFEGRRVLCIGAGESGADICLQTARVAAAHCISVRGQHGHFVPREVVGRPSDLDTSRAHYTPPYAMRRMCMWTIESLLFGYGVLSCRQEVRQGALLNLKNGTTPHDKFGCKNLGLVEALALGSQLKGAIKRVYVDHVEFEDGSSFECDAIICCTGYVNEFPWFAEDEFPHLTGAKGDVRQFFKHMFPRDHLGQLALVGFVRPAFGAIPPMSEMQARYLALLWSGARQLPDTKEMERMTLQDRDDAVARYGHDALRVPSLEDFLLFQDGMADLIGCKPDLPALFRESPKLWWHVMAGPIMAAHYRLRGPQTSPEQRREAVEVILRTPTGNPAANSVFLALVGAAHCLSSVGFASCQPHQ